MSPNSSSDVATVPVLVLRVVGDPGAHGGLGPGVEGKAEARVDPGHGVDGLRDEVVHEDVGEARIADAAAEREAAAYPFRPERQLLAPERVRVHVSRRRGAGWSG